MVNFSGHGNGGHFLGSHLEKLSKKAKNKKATHPEPRTERTNKNERNPQELRGGKPKTVMATVPKWPTFKLSTPLTPAPRLLFQPFLRQTARKNSNYIPYPFNYPIVHYAKRYKWVNKRWKIACTTKHVRSRCITNDTRAHPDAMTDRARVHETFPSPTTGDLIKGGLIRSGEVFGWVWWKK